VLLYIPLKRKKNRPNEPCFGQLHSFMSVVLKIIMCGAATICASSISMPILIEICHMYVYAGTTTKN
jgi:hypothetical protein